MIKLTLRRFANVCKFGQPVILCFFRYRETYKLEQLKAFKLEVQALRLHVFFTDRTL